ncbi:uncharacterized protein EV420DRAFT_1721414 [Desarmillaria tabescens]|uniref:UvrD-like helicase ATP-binding domain-containing protein n=1 Tax=Armillaria tabescens TaxID=1929756 RepID=A0AA39JP58_ARMTA|nr:uncharacterized protein EV420DRAFT_1721414 [Desarmillaria tabescens]KAK0444909.1 hypothetical protein EV420DRAFT_1721414 [Desarmillaria tabescens]
MPRKRILRSDLFNQEQLVSMDALESALQELQSLLTKDNFKHVFQDLIDNESPRILLLVLSSLSETTSLMITSWLLESFPSSPAEYDASVHYVTLSCLSSEFRSCSFIEDKELCARYYQMTQITPRVLSYLISFLRPKGNAKQSQRNFQQARPDDNTTILVKRYFNVLNADMPETSGEASVLVDHVLQSQKDTLKFYLELLRRPGISIPLKERCITSTSPIKEENKNPSGSVVPSAFPIVQPMKSALYFDTAEDFGDWTVIISTNADNFLRTAHKKDLFTFNITVKKIKELSCGYFTDNNQKRLSGSATEVPVFEAKIARNLRVIYQINVIPGDDGEQQAIKIFGIYTHAQIDNRLWSSISAQLRKKGKEYRKRCVARKRADQASKDTFIPAFFPPLPEVSPSDIESLPDLRPEETAQVHSRLVVEKYVTFLQPFLNTILADVDAIFPHMVSVQEKCIIEHPKSCYVIGRSGTGKTTTMLFKMLLIERTFQLMESGLPRPRQVFITKSRMLAKKVKEYFEKLASSLAMASQSSADPTNLPRAPQYQDDLGLIDEDDDVDWGTDLPAKYSELEERHFPLFITFDGLCDMLEADMSTQTLTDTRRTGIKRQMGVITFESFCESYWSHFPEPLIKGLDPALVFSEIIGNIFIYLVLKGIDPSLRSGVIEGSAETLSEEKHHLNKDAYLDLSKRRQSTFADQRCEVYRLFELYMRKKKLRGEYDTGDRTHGILKHFTENGIPGKGLDHLYVDEVQDNMLIDTMILRALCSNADGLFWAGDTAQTISVGSSFCFNALKAFQWNIEDQYRRKHRPGVRCKQPPEMFQLTVNYRSHAGIVDCAHSIIELITTFWEDSIDRLSPEMGIIDGVKPIFFNNEDRAQLDQFIFHDGGDPIEFGAQQCIIVRNEMARERLQQKVGEIGLVLTVYESKGLEFNDVLLYNFFADSPAGLAQWRVVLNAIEESKQDPGNPPPRFDHIRHASICNELKSLYVAITRARENIWIADGSEKGEPMRIFWTNKDLINNYTRGSDAPRLASSSTPEEWAAEGRELFNAKRFLQAKHCYIKAGLPLLASIADAYEMRAKARRVMGTSTQKVLERRSYFAEAAKLFFECAKGTKVSTNPKDSMTYLRISGECFEQADKKHRAAQVFLRAQEYTHAAELYIDIGRFDDAVAVMKGHKDEMSLKVVKDVIKLARLAYFSNGQMKKAHDLFDTFEEEVEYLEERDLDVALADLLETKGKVCEAAELHYSKGRKQQAIVLFLCQAQNKNALHRAQECVLEELWYRISFGVDPNAIRSDPTVKRLMLFASRLDVASMERTKAAELSMFKAIINDPISRLHALGLNFYNIGNSTAALLCLDQYFSQACRIRDLVLVDAVEKLSLFDTYVGLLSTTAFRTDPSRDATTAALFGFRRNTTNEFLVPPNTWLYSAALKLRPKNMLRDSSNLRLSVPELRMLFRQALQIHLKRMIAAENDECGRSKAFTLCLEFAVSGICMRPECPEAHVPPSEIDPSYYNMRIRLHLQQILILQLLTAFKENDRDESENREITKFWLSRLCDALHPPDRVFGSISDLALSTIPEAPKALDVVRDWIQILVYGREYLPPIQLSPDVMRTALLALMFDRSQAGHLRNTPYSSAKHPPSMYIRRRNGFVLHNLLSSMSGDQTWSLTAGCLFVERIIKQRFHINIGVVCDFLDLLCSSAILFGVRLETPLLHNMIVPRNWLLCFVSYHSSPYVNEEMQTNYYRTLLEPMRDLLEQLCVGRGCEHLLYHGTSENLSNLPYKVRCVFVARIFNAIGLLGYNIHDESLRSDIQKLMLSLRQEDRLFSHLYGRYIDAASRSWDELVEVICHSIEYDAKDETIQLVHQSRTPEKKPTSLQVRQLVYRDFTDIQAQLALTKSASTPATSPHKIHEQKEPDGDASKAKGTEDTQEAKAVEEAAGEGVEVVDTIPTQDMTTPDPTEREIAAASLIQRAYRKVLRCRRGVAERGTAGLRAQIYASCTEEVSRLGDKPGLYLRLFLGPLPHILVCLEIVCIDTHKHKTKTKSRLSKKCTSDEYGALGDLLTKTTKANQTAIKLQKLLSPKSTFHGRCDVKELKRQIEEVNCLVSSLPFDASLDLSNDLHLAGIVTGSERSSAHTRKNLKPKLNTTGL